MEFSRKTAPGISCNLQTAGPRHWRANRGEKGAILAATVLFMLKMYQRGEKAGDSADFWEANWSSDRFDDGVRFCAVDPLRPILERHASPGSLMLEGGCGQGQYVAYYADAGLRVVGLDFAGDTLARLRERRRDLLLCVGNVAVLPFRTGSFDVYYSGGVVEHFEAGAEPALREAWRVLRPKGRFLVSVPYFNPLRRALALFRKAQWKRMPSAEVDARGLTANQRFWQYAYTQDEFVRLLSIVGFRVIARQGYSILWGLYELPLVSRIVVAVENRLRQRRVQPGPSVEPGGPLHGGTGGGNRLKEPQASQPSLLRRLVVSEDATVPLAGLVVRGLRATCANMMMFVCER
jgi:SAM-dependent methyltransferase